MAGVCPNCVTYRHEDGSCAQCGSPLLSPSQWKQKRKMWLPKSYVDGKIKEILGPSAPETHIPNQEDTETTVKDKKDFVLGFFLSALLFFFALLISYILLSDNF